MGRKSREQAKRLGKLEKARQFHQSLNNNASADNSRGSLIDPGVVELPKGEILPSSVAENSEIPEPAETCIAIYLLPRCLDHKQIDGVDNVDARALVKKLHFINLTKASYALNITRDKIEKGGKYDYFYKEVPPDADVYEIKFRDKGRIFGFFSGHILNVVAIRTQHINI